MNRMLIIPAGCCLVLFVALWAGLSGAADKESRVLTTARENVSAAAATKPTLPATTEPLALEEVEQSLTALTGEYLRPWRQQETSPRYLYSRVAPRPILSISADVEWTASANSPTDGAVVAAIVIKTGMRSETLPCVVDRVTRKVRVFVGGKWLTEAEWLSQAPLPN
jgi:hypothetical protein